LIEEDVELVPREEVDGDEDKDSAPEDGEDATPDSRFKKSLGGEVDAVVVNEEDVVPGEDDEAEEAEEADVNPNFRVDVVPAEDKEVDKALRN